MKTWEHDLDPATAGPAHGGGAGAGVPLPDEPAIGPEACPALAGVLDDVAEMNRLAERVTRVLGVLQETGEVEDTTGIPLELWLSQVGRMNTADRLTRQRTATSLRRMPAVATAFRTGKLSDGQVRVIANAVRQLPKDLIAAVDDVLASEIDTYAQADPDDLLARLNMAIAAAMPEREERDAATVRAARFLNIQPSLLGGYGGQLYGEGPNEDLVLIAEGLARMIPPPDGSPRRAVGADADPDHDTFASQGRRRWDALVGLFATHPAMTGRDGDVSLTALRDGDDRTPVPVRAGVPLHLTVTTTLDSLLALADRPGHLVTTLAGGRLRVTAALARTLAEAGGTLRLLVTDDHGEVIGVGRRTRVPPDWLAEAIRAMWPTSIGPNARTSSAHCDIDHHAEWDRDCGPTDLDNLAPVDRTFHTAKTAGEWTIRPGPDGSRIVEHPRSGWRQTVLPATRTIDLVPSRERPSGVDPPS